MNGRILGRFLRMVGRVRPEQLAHRLRLSVRRRYSVRFGDVRHAGWWTRPPPPVRRAASFPPPAGDEPRPEGRLPLKVDLAGAPFIIDARTDWTLSTLSSPSALRRLTVHYTDFIGSLEPAAALAVMLDWIRQNEPYPAEYWLRGWNSYGLAVRVVSWIRRLAADDLEMSEVEAREVRLSLARQLRFLADNLELDIGGNHLIRNIRALLFGAQYFSGPEARTWAETATFHLRRELVEQVPSDGLHFELSPSYHLQVFDDLMDCYVLLTDSRLRSDLFDALRRMAQVVVDTTHPDGKPSLFNDGGLDTNATPSEHLRKFELLGGVAPSARRVWTMPSAGLFGARWGDDLVIVDCGQIGPDHLPAHAHADALAFVWHLDGSRFVVDCGVAEYEPGSLRALSRSTLAHNTVTLDDLDQAEFWSSFRVGRRPKVSLVSYETSDEGFNLVGCHDGYSHLAGAPIHRRTLRVRRDELLVTDEIVGGAGQRVDSRLLLGPTIRAVRRDLGYVLEGSGTTVLLRTECAVSVAEASWMPNLGEVRATEQVRINLGQAPCQATFRLSVVARSP